MKLQIKIYLCALITLCAISCSRKSTISKTDTVTIIRDSIHEKEVVRLDTVVIPGDTLQTTFTIECDSVTNMPKPAKFKGSSKRLVQTIVVGNTGQITAYCAADSLLHVVASKDREIAIYKALAYTKSDSNTTVIERKVIPKWVWYSLAANVVLGLWTLRKPIKIIFVSLLKVIPV